MTPVTAPARFQPMRHAGSETGAPLLHYEPSRPGPAYYTASALAIYGMPGTLHHVL